MSKTLYELKPLVFIGIGMITLAHSSDSVLLTACALLLIFAGGVITYARLTYRGHI